MIPRAFQVVLVKVAFFGSRPPQTTFYEVSGPRPVFLLGYQLKFQIENKNSKFFRTSKNLFSVLLNWKHTRNTDSDPQTPILIMERASEVVLQASLLLTLDLIGWVRVSPKFFYCFSTKNAFFGVCGPRRVFLADFRRNPWEHIFFAKFPPPPQVSPGRCEIGR